VDRDGTAYFESEILLEKPEHMLLRSGMTANADVAVETFESTVKVPSQAVQDRNIDDLPRELVERAAFVDRNKRFVRVVFVFEGGKTVARPVDVGASDLTHTVVRAGLDEGVRIVVGPFKTLASLKHDQRVEDEDLKPAEKKGERTAGGADRPAGQG